MSDVRKECELLCTLIGAEASDAVDIAVRIVTQQRVEVYKEVGRHLGVMNEPWKHRNDYVNDLVAWCEQQAREEGSITPSRGFLT